MSNLQLLMSKLYFRASELSWDHKTFDWNGLHKQTITHGFEDLALWSSNASPPKPMNTSILHPELFSPSKLNSSYFALSLDLAGIGSEFFQFLKMGKATVIRKGNWREAIRSGQRTPVWYIAFTWHQGIPQMILTLRTFSTVTGRC